MVNLVRYNYQTVTQSHPHLSHILAQHVLPHASTRHEHKQTVPVRKQPSEKYSQKLLIDLGKSGKEMDCWMNQEVSVFIVCWVFAILFIVGVEPQEFLKNKIDAVFNQHS